MSDDNEQYAPQSQKSHASGATSADTDIEPEPYDPPRHPAEARAIPIAPDSIEPSRLPTPMLECGCGECCETLVDPLAVSEATVYAGSACDEPQPVSVDKAAEIYVRYQLADNGHDGRHDDHRRLYGTLMEGDRKMQRRYGDDLTTVLLTRRLSPTSDSGEWIPPVSLHGRLSDGATAVTRGLRRYDLGDFEFEYAAVTAFTRGVGTPHEHICVYVDDPHDEVTAEQLRPTIETHVRETPGADSDGHGEGAIRVQHDPDLFVPEKLSQIFDKSDAVDGDGFRRSVPANTAMVVYVASQLPHLVLHDVAGERRKETGVTQGLIDGGATAWASPWKTVRSSDGFPT